MSKSIIVLFLGLLAAGAVFAKEWSTNAAHSEIIFEVKYLKWSEVTGRFEKLSGSMEFNKEHQTPEKLTLRIDSASIDTGNDMRDGHLRGHDFFDSKTYPLITFVSTEIKQIGQEEFDLVGVLTIRAVSRLHKLRINLSAPIRDTWGYENRFLKFSTEVNRQDFGLKWNKTIEGGEFLVGDSIRVKGSFQLQPTSKGTPHSKHRIPDTPYIREREKLTRGELGQADTLKIAPNGPIKATTHSAPVAGPEKNRPMSIMSKRPVSGTKLEARNFTWWTSYMILGLFGFFGVTLGGIYAKRMLLREHLSRYEETGFMGNLSDLVIIVLVFIYSWAFWFIGWGS
jgi:polyisoprenoid-binding protein YceI